MAKGHQAPNSSGTTSGIEEILERWRNEVKCKQRRIISFEDTVDIKVASIRPLIYPETAPIDGWLHKQFHFTSKQERNFVDDEWKPIAVGDTWGGPDMSALFKCTTQIPQEFDGKKVVLKIYFGGDGLLSINGTPYMGMDPFRDTIPWSNSAKGGETLELELESYIFWHFGEGTIKNVESSHFAVFDQEMNDIFWDLKTAVGMMNSPNSSPELKDYLASAIKAAIHPIDQNETDPERCRANARAAGSIIRERIYEVKAHPFKQDGLIHLSGHSHLDVVFLWTYAEFVRKLGRTHANTLRLMDEYPDYIFSQSQPVMYKEMKDHYPEMYEQVKAKVKEGRWEVVGAMWVEPDCNVPSGESFVRQILHGIRFCQQEFGVRPRTCWCPDVFGNTWSMPQILVRAGLEYFVTHKMITWNDTNPWTKNTFWWEGPDGSRVLALVPPTHFIGTMDPDHLQEHWSKFSDKKTIGETLYNFGWGDGGGGPDAEMLEYQKRLKNFPGLPETKAARIEDAIDSMSTKALDAKLPIWNDELYLEEHRGIQTTKARLKKFNRRLEYLYRDAEIWSVLANGPYPQEALDAAWKDLLTNQFHDSLPGSHITQVYHDLLEIYENISATGKTIKNTALEQLAEQVETKSIDGEPVVVFNSLPQMRETTVKLALDAQSINVKDAAGHTIPHQFITDNETGQSNLAFGPVSLPGLGLRTFYLCKAESDAVIENNLTVSKTLLENELIRVELNAAGEITSLVEKATGAEYIDGSKGGNVFKLYEDVPGKYEAWDIAPSYTDVEFELDETTIQVVEEGPVRAAVEITKPFFNSLLRQRIVITAGSPRLDFETWVDWKEQQKLLKVRFYTPFITREATYDIAFANQKRATTRNNSFEEAKFEVPFHRWVDMSQTDRGLTLMNNCKYSGDAFDGMMGMSLLRGPKIPDPESDQEEHTFTYSLMPHQGSWQQGGIEKAAADLNQLADVVITDVHDGTKSDGYTFLALDAENVELAAMKKAEDSDAMILRLVERYGQTGPVNVTLPFNPKAITECDLLEENDQPANTSVNGFSFTINPYEIRTFKIQRD